MLKDKIDQFKAQMAGKIPADAKQVMAESTAGVAATVESRGLPKLGDVLKPFELPDSQGTMHSLSSLTTDKPLIITFFRGDW